MKFFNHVPGYLNTQASAPISGLSETSSNSEDSEMEPDDSEDMDSSIERVFMTGSLDELSVRFSSSNQVFLKHSCFYNLPHYSLEK